MTKQLVITTLGAILAVGTKINPSLSKNLSRGYEKCYGNAEVNLNDLDASDALARQVWLGLPRGTCNKIISANNTKG